MITWVQGMGLEELRTKARGWDDVGTANPVC